MKFEQLIFSNPPEHINPYLTHWTGNNKSEQEAIEILKTILLTKRLKFSENQISFPHNKATLSQIMICFTDTPIKLSSEHCKKYKSVGISFNKQMLIDDGANPVFYLTDSRQRNQKQLDKVYYQENEPKHLIGWVTSMTQPYNTKPLDLNHYAEFNEREWRMVRVLPYTYLSEIEKAQGLINEFKFPTQIISENEVFYFPFEINMIDNIIIPTSYKTEVEFFLKNNNIEITIYLTDV